MASEQFSLCWDNFHKNMSSGMNSLLENEDLVDVTLAVEGKYLKAHKMVLSVCSPYFKELFKVNPCQHPIVFMKDVSYVAISDLLQFMYQGEVQVSQDNLTTFIKTAEALQIKGLTGDGNGTDADPETSQDKPSVRHVEETYKPMPRPKKQLPAPVVTTTPAAKKPRLSVSSNDSQSTPAPITKTEPANESTQFKVEPFDQNQSVTIPDDGDETFGDDTLDDNTVDDNEDYSMMEGEEPQAGTSTDGTGEGQGRQRYGIPHGATYHGGYTYGMYSGNTASKMYLRCSGYRSTGCRGKGYILRGKGMESFVLVDEHSHPPNFLLERRSEIAKTLKEYAATIPGKPIDVYKSVVSIYLRCLEYKRLGCRARAVIPYDGSLQDIKLNKPHNHPPDSCAEEKIIFIRELKEVMLKNPTVPNRTIYQTLAEMFPNAAREIPFESMRGKMNRWRREAMPPQQQIIIEKKL